MLEKVAEMSELSKLAKEMEETIISEDEFYECYRKGCFFRRTKAKYLQSKSEINE